MNDKDKAKKIILEELSQEKVFLLNSIFPEFQQHSISDKSVKEAIKELENEGIIKTEDLRGEFWELKITNTQI